MKILLLIIALACGINATTWYQGAGGDNANDGKSWGNRLLTLKAGVDSVRAGDTLYTSGDTVDAKIIVNMNGGERTTPTATTPVYIIGCDSSGVQLTELNYAVITANTAMTCLCTLGVEAAYFNFVNIHFDGRGTGYATNCILGSSGDGPNGLTFLQCKISNAIQYGIYARWSANITSAWTFDKCDISNNGMYDIGNSSSSRSPVRIFRCLIGPNGSMGVTCGVDPSPHIVIGSIVYGNATANIDINSKEL